MKLKPVVATMCVLGLGAAGSAFAAGNTDAQIANLQSQIQKLQAQVSHSQGGKTSEGAPAHGGLVTTDAKLSHIINGDQQLVGQDMELLQASKAGNVPSGLTLGGSAQADAFYQHTNSVLGGEAIFSNPYLGSTGGSNKNGTAVTLTNLKLSMLANFSNWANAVVQVGDYYPSRDLSSPAPHRGLDNQKLQIQQAYVLMGNLNEAPFYSFIGRRYIDFGQFENVNLFSQPLTREFFQAAGDTAGVGFVDNGLNASVSIMNGGYHNDTVYATNGVVGQNMFTNDSGRIRNYAAQLGYGQVNNGVNWHVGVGFLNSGSRSVARFSQGGDKQNLSGNKVYDLNGKVSVDNFDVYAEVLRTDHSAAQYAPLLGKNAQLTTESGTSKAGAWQLAGDYKFASMGHDSVFSLGFSRATSVMHNHGSLDQYVVGLKSEAVKNVWTGIEYSYLSATNAPIMIGDNVFESKDFNNQTVTLDVKAYF